LGVVIIGRNEGERLKRCLESLGEHANRAVYVDSGSTDGSVAESKARGFAVVQLDLRTPFTAARARNEGFNRLLELETVTARYVRAGSTLPYDSSKRIRMWPWSVDVDASDSPKNQSTTCCVILSGRASLRARRGRAGAMR
jgi:glycosyltransferase involved in cell wall biosynthesis